MPQEKTRKNLEGGLIRQAWMDESFREALLKDSTRVYSEHLAELEPGASLPEGLKVRVVEETDKRLYLVLPAAAPDAPEEPLGDRSTREDFEAAIVWQAYQQESVHLELLRDPKSLYEKQLDTIKEGASLPDDLEIEAVEESDEVLYLRIPQPPPDVTELTAEELELVAGGKEEAITTAVAVGVAAQSYVVVGAVAVAAVTSHLV